MHIRSVTKARPAQASDAIIVLDMIAQILNIIMTAVAAFDSVQSLFGKQQ